MSYRFALIMIMIIGLVPALIYLALHWIPARWRSIAAVDASSWVVVIVLLYGWSLARTISAPMARREWAADTIVWVVIGLLIDAVLWVRLAHWFIVVRHRPPASTQREKS